ncbi:G-protein coupled receptor Mth2-like [Diadema antillarum]|uniref:G-protein coupled receptor Mth2-like n=1 Tax=Diadema antillarum TaxID=105358 RepID=UPI003A84F922
MAWEDEYIPYMSCVELVNIRTHSALYQLISRCPDEVPQGSRHRINCENPTAEDKHFITPVTVAGGPTTKSNLTNPPCFRSPSLGNISVYELVLEAPAGWNCSDVAPVDLQKTNVTLLEPFRTRAWYTNCSVVVHHENRTTTCPTAEALPCDSNQVFRADDFEIVTADSGLLSLRLASESQLIDATQFRLMADGSAWYCRQKSGIAQSDLPEGLDIISYVGTSLSILSLLIVIATYIVFPRLRNVAGKSILSLCLSLLVVFLSIFLSEITSDENTFCKTLAVVSHFLWLAIFFWMNVLAIDLCRTFGSRAKIQVGTTSSLRHFICYSLYAWGAPAIIVGIFLALDLCRCTSFEVGYGKDGVCALSRGSASVYGFGVPLASILFCNAVLFTDTVVGIRLTKKASERALKERSNIEKAKEELSLYIKLSGVMGFTWALAYICNYANIPELWYVFTVVNSLQGVFLLLVFGFNRRNIALWRQKLGLKGEEVTSSAADIKSSGVSSVS